MWTERHASAPHSLATRARSCASGLFSALRRSRGSAPRRASSAASASDTASAASASVSPVVPAAPGLHQLSPRLTANDTVDHEGPALLEPSHGGLARRAEPSLQLLGVDVRTERDEAVLHVANVVTLVPTKDGPHRVSISVR